jgi:hypothetical protein
MMEGNLIQKSIWMKNFLNKIIFLLTFNLSIKHIVFLILLYYKIYSIKCIV